MSICIAAIIITKQPQKNLRLLEKQQFIKPGSVQLNASVSPSSGIKYSTPRFASKPRIV